MRCEELREVHVAEEAHAARRCTIPVRESTPLRFRAHVILAPPADRKLTLRELVLRELPEEVGLILHVVNAAMEFNGIVHATESCVVPRRNSLRTDLTCDCGERIEFHPPVARRIGIRCLPDPVRGDHWCQDLARVLRAHVTNDEWDAEVRRHAMCHGHILSPRTWDIGDCNFQEAAHDVEPTRLEECGRERGVDATGETDYDADRHMADAIEGTIARFDAKGRGVLVTDDGDVLVPFAIPGDTVRVELRGKRRGVWRGVLADISTPSSDRITPRCPYVGRCGGCPWQMIDYPAQLRAKRAFVYHALQGLAVPEVPEVEPSPDTFYFRNRMDYVVGPNGELGLKAPEQWWNVLDLSTCFLLSPEAVEIMSRFRTWMREHDVIPWNNRTHSGFARYLVIREGKRTGERMAMVVTASGELPGREDLIARLQSLTTSILWGINSRITDLSIADQIHVLHGSEVLRERLSILQFEIPPNVFFQTNTLVAEQLVTTVRELATRSPTDLLVDLYCGVGVFSIALAHDAARVIGVESDPEAIAAAQRNAITNGVTNVQFTLALAESWSFPIDPIDVLILDPPRSGLHPRVIQKILALQPERVIYVSCNPTALGRDLQPLLTKYTCDAVRCLDLFPHSPHVETVVRLVRT